MILEIIVRIDMAKASNPEKKSAGRLDAVDKKILDLLQDNAKLTIKEIGARLHLTPTPVYERIRRMEKQGIISRYVALLNRARTGNNLMAFCAVSLDTHKAEYISTFEKEAVKLAEVQECYHVAGQNDYLLKVTVTSMEEYQSFLAKKLASLQHIGKVVSSLVMSEIKHTHKVRL